MNIYFSTLLQRNIGSYFIRGKFGINAKYSHVTLEFQSDDIRYPAIFECSNYGVRLIEKSLFFKENKVVSMMKIPVDKEREQEIKNFMFSKLGYRYSFLGPLLFITGWFRKYPLTFRRRDRSTFNCSEIVYLCLRKELAPYLDDYYNQNAYLISPRDVFTSVKNYLLDQKRINEGHLLENDHSLREKKIVQEEVKKIPLH